MKKSKLRQIIREEIRRLTEAAKVQVVNKDIAKYKKALIKKWKSKGGYENFGQTEVRKLRDKYADYGDYSDDMKSIRDVINAFDDWAGDYDGE